MNTWQCLLSIICLSSFCRVNAAHNLEVDPNIVQLGTIHIGQKIETVIKLKNLHNETFIIDNLKSSCGCEKPIVDFNSISPSEEQRLKVLSFPKKQGRYSHRISIIPKGNTFNPANIFIVGNVVQTLRAQVGWNPKETFAIRKSVSHVDLGVIRKKKNRILHILVTPKTIVTEVNDIHFVSLHSRFFELVENNVKYYPLDIGGRGIHLNARLRQDVSESDFCTDEIEIWLDKERMVSIPVKCRLVDDVYVNPASVYLGKLDSEKSIEAKMVSIFFEDSSAMWKKLSWKVDGGLSQALDVQVVDIDNKDNCIKVNLNIKQDTIESLQNGFISSNLTIWEEDSDNNKSVKLLVYAYNSRS